MIGARGFLGALPPALARVPRSISGTLKRKVAHA